jgi:hypothetical protein
MSTTPGDFACSTRDCADSKCERKQDTIPDLPKKITDRVKGQIYMKKGRKVGWNGKITRDCCNESSCETTPVYNREGESKGLYCTAHKKEGMVNVKHKTCCEKKCKTRATCNYEGETTGVYCAVHKKEGMINATSKRCCENGCKTQPLYNRESETKGLYCAAHKKEEMVDVRSKKCCEEECKKIPHYNHKGYSNGLYCRKHKKEGMVSLISKRSCDKVYDPIRVQKKSLKNNQFITLKVNKKGCIVATIRCRMYPKRTTNKME